MGSPLSLEIIHIISSQQSYIPHLYTYNGKGVHVTHLKTFQVICSDYDHDNMTLAKLFAHNFHDKALNGIVPCHLIVLIQFTNLPMLLSNNFKTILVLKCL